MTPSERTEVGDRLEQSADLLVTSLCVGNDGELLPGDVAADDALDAPRETLALYKNAPASEHIHTADVLAEALGALMEWPRASAEERPDFKVILYALEMARYQYGGESRHT